MRSSIISPARAASSRLALHLERTRPGRPRQHGDCRLRSASATGTAVLAMLDDANLPDTDKTAICASSATSCATLRGMQALGRGDLRRRRWPL